MELVAVRVLIGLITQRSSSKPSVISCVEHASPGANLVPKLPLEPRNNRDDRHRFFECFVSVSLRSCWLVFTRVRLLMLIRRLLVQIHPGEPNLLITSEDSVPPGPSDLLLGFDFCRDSHDISEQRVVPGGEIHVNGHDRDVTRVERGGIGIVGFWFRWGFATQPRSCSFSDREPGAIRTTEANDVWRAEAQELTLFCHAHTLDLISRQCRIVHIQPDSLRQQSGLSCEKSWLLPQMLDKLGEVVGHLSIVDPHAILVAIRLVRADGDPADRTAETSIEGPRRRRPPFPSAARLNRCWRRS